MAIFNFKDFPNTDTPIDSSNLNLMQDLIFDWIYPVGSYYETSNVDFNPNTNWIGTWVLETDGTVLASKSTTVGSILNAPVSSIVGEEKHKLTVSELPSHRHGLRWINPIVSGGTAYFADAQIVAGYGVSSSDRDLYTSQRTTDTGEGNLFNITQKTKIINRWHRTT